MSMNHPSYSSSYPQRLRECEAWAMAMHNNTQPREPSSFSLQPSRYQPPSESDFTSFFPSILYYLSKPYAFAFSSSFSSSSTSISTTSPHCSQPLSSSTSSSLHPPLPYLSILTLSSTFLSIPQSADLVWTIIVSGAFRSIEACSDRAE